MLSSKNEFLKRGMSFLLAGLIITYTVVPSFISDAQDSTTNTNTAANSNADVSPLILTKDDLIVKDGKIVGLNESSKAKILANPNIQINGLDDATEIGENAFKDLTLDSAIIGDGITKIGDHAFQRTKLKKLILKAGITEISSYAFADNKLTSINFEGTVDSIGDYAFYSNDMSNIKIDAKNIGKNAFSANKLKEVTLSNVSDVGVQAFDDNPDLKKVTVETENPPAELFKEDTFAESDEPVDVYVAKNGNNISAVDKRYRVNPITIKLSIIDKSNDGLILDVIESKHSLGEFPVKLDAPSIDGYAVSDSDLVDGKLTVEKPSEGVFDISASLDYVRTNSPKIVVEDSKQLTFKKDRSLTTVDILKNVVFLDSDGVEVEHFVNGNTLNPKISVNPSTIPAPNAEKEVEVELVLTDPTNGAKDTAKVKFKFTSIDLGEEYIVDGQDWQYKDFTYSRNYVTGLSDTGKAKIQTNKNLVLPGIHPQTGEPIKEINTSAFSNTAIDTVNFEKMENLEVIGHYAFLGTGISAVTNLDKLQKLREIRVESFKKTRLKSFEFDVLNNLESIQRSAFLESQLEDVSITGLQKLRVIETSAFQSNNIKNLQLSNLPKLTIIDNWAFHKNKISGDLELDNLPELETIGHAAFQENKIENVKFRDLNKLKTIREVAFENNLIQTVNISDLKELVSIEGESTFANNRIKSLEFEDMPKLERINGFKNNQIEKVTFNNLPKLRILGDNHWTFYNNKLKEVVIENLPELELIGHGIFRGNPDLKKATIKDLPKLKNMRPEIFSNTGLEDVTLENLPLLENINGFTNAQLKKIEIVDLPKVKEITGFQSNRLETVKIEKLPELTKIDTVAFHNNRIKDLNLNDLPKLEILGSHAFASNQISEIDLSKFANIKTIKNNAFSNNQIRDFSFLNKMENLEVIEGSAFSNNQATKIVLNHMPALTRIDDYAFDQNKIDSVEVTGLEKLERIGNRAFGVQGNRETLRKVKISNNPKLKYLSGFAYNEKLKDVTLEDLPALEEIGDEAFYNTAITDIDLTKFTTLKKIGRNAFSDDLWYSGKNRLTELKLPTSIEEIGESAYKNNEIKNLDLSKFVNLKKIKDEAFQGNAGTAVNFKLPATLDPIELGREIATVRNEDLDFSKDAGVKIKLTSAKPFKTSGPLVMHFDNDSQLELDANLKNLDPNNPTIIYIDNVTNHDKFKNLPAGIIVNPSRVKIKHQFEDGSPVVALEDKLEVITTGGKVKAPEFAGYKVVGIETKPNTFADFDADTGTATATGNVPAKDGELIFKYRKVTPIPKDDFIITVKRTNFTNKNFRHKGQALTVESTFDLKGIDVDNDVNINLVVQLPEYASTNPADIVFPATIPNVELVGNPYYDPVTKQVIYKVKKFKDSSKKIALRTDFKFGLDTPKDYVGTVKAMFVRENGDVVGNPGESEQFIPTYDNPRFAKTSAYNEGDTFQTVPDADSDGKYANVSMTYTFEINYLHRTIDSFEITDNIPRYKKYDATTGGFVEVEAQFDEAKNPGWKKTADGKVTYTLTAGEIQSLLANKFGTEYLNWLNSTQVLPKLVLDFPMAVEQGGIRNTADYSMKIKNPKFSDSQNFTGTVTRDRAISFFKTSSNSVNFSKGSLEEHYLQPRDNDTTKDYPWRIKLSPGEVRRLLDGNTERYVPTLSNIEIWDLWLENGTAEKDKFLEYNYIIPNMDAKVYLYEDDFSIYNNNRAEWSKATPFATYTVKSGTKFFFTKEERQKTKRMKFVFEGVELSKLTDEISIDIGTKLRDGKITPNETKYLYNYAKVFLDTRIDELNLKSDYNSYVNAYKSILKAKRKISVRKTADIRDGEIIKDPEKKINYELGINAGFTNDNLKGKFFIENFELVDVLPRELEVKGIEINPKFIEAGGILETKDNGVNGSLLKFKSPSLRSDINWIAKIKTGIKLGAAGDTTFTNRAYINFKDDAPNVDDRYQVDGLQATPEEGGAQRSTAKHSLRIFVNDSLVAKKFIRRSSVDGAWTDSINTIPGEEFEYKFEFSNNFSSPIKKLKFLDIFPNVGDFNITPNPLGVRELRLSDFSNEFVNIKSVRVFNYKTKQYTDLNIADFPVQYLGKVDDFPKTAAEGTTNNWINKAIADPSYLTDKDNAKGIFIGGDNSTIPEYSQLEIVVTMKAPKKELTNSAEWKGKSAINTVGYFYDGASRYGESTKVSNTLEPPKKRFRFKKVDKDSNEPLSGAVYRLVQGNNKIIGTSGPDGYVYFNDIEYSEFKIFEEIPPKGYKVNTVPIQKVLNYDNYAKDLEELKKDQNYIETFENALDEKVPEPDGRIFTIKVNKTNSILGPVKNVKFKLEKLGTAESFEGFTGNDGVVKFENLVSAQYRLIEEANLNRFTVIEPVILELPLANNFNSNSIKNLTTTVDAQNPNHTIYEFNIENEKYDIDLYKLGVEDLEGNLKDYEVKIRDGKRLPNIEFKLYQTNKIIQNGGVSVGNTAEEELGVFSTNRAGKISLNNLSSNVVYRLEELNTPEIYEKGRDVEFYLDGNGHLKTIDGNNYANSGVVIVLNNKKTEKSVIEITKVDAESSNKLSGATFQLLKLQGGKFVPMNEDDENNKKFTKTTDSDGKVTFYDVEHGLYEVREVNPPSGYIAGLEPIRFNVLPYNSKLFKKTVKNKKIALEVIKVEKLAGPYENQQLAEQQLATLINERDDDADLFVANKMVYKKLKGAEFKLTEPSAQNRVIDPEVKPNANDYTVYKFGVGLTQYGSYKLTETKAPDGYRKTADKVIKTDRLITYNNSELTYYVENNKVTGQINITKFEGRDNKVLPGATFKIYKGKLTKDQLSDDKLVYTKTTDKDGIIRILDVPLGDYTIVETESPKNYKVLDGVTHITLTFDNPNVRKSFYNNLDTVTLKFKKVDDLGQPIANLNGSEFKLYCDGVEHSTGTISTEANEVGIVKFENVPIIGNYKIKEINAPENYLILGNGGIEFTHDDNNPLTDDTEPMVLKNREQIEINATKSWVGGKEEERPNVFFKLFRKVEGGAEEALNVENIQVGKVNKTVDFGKFDKYQHTDGQEPKLYTYFVKEVDENGDELNLSTYNYTRTAEETLNVQNTYESPKTDLTVTKTWTGGENVEKPNYVFKLFRKIQGGNLESVNDNGVQITREVPKAPTTGNLISVKFENIAINDNNGEKYIYVVKEVKEDGSEINLTDVFRPESGDEKEAGNIIGTDKLVVSFNNVYESPKKEVTATKVWVNGPQNRPEVYFKLFRKAGQNGQEESVSLSTKVAENNNVVWSNLDLTDSNGTEYIYFVKEVNSTGDDFKPENYTKVEEGLQVTNTYVSPKIPSMSVKKLWDMIDGENKPSEVELTLFRKSNGLKEANFSQKIILTQADGNWSKEITDLDKTDANGVDYVYYVEEKAINGYTPNYGNDATGIVVTNIQNKISKSVSKEWVNNVQGENNPNKAVAILNRNGGEYRRIELNDANSWKHTFENLPEFDENGIKYNYEIIEENISGYTPSIDAVTGKITNTKNVVSIEVTKTWVDEANNLDRPTEITLNLYRNGDMVNPYKTAKLSGIGNEWKHTFDNLPERDADGNVYQYTVDEVAVPGYEKIVNKYSITNTRTLTTVPVTKVWNHNEVMYPDNITFRLMRDNVEIATKVLTKQEAETAGNWNYIFQEDKDGHKLPLTNPNNGNPYSYTVSEDAVIGFTTTYSTDTKTVTNTQNTKEVTINKSWINGPKPDVELVLKRRVAGTEDTNFSKIFTVTAANLSKTFTVPTHNANGEEYEYFVDELNVPENYTKSISDLTVTNTFEIPKGQKEAKVSWINGTTIKPEAEIKLYRTVNGVIEEVPNTVNIKKVVTRTGDSAIEETMIVWDEIELTDINGVPYTFSVKEVNKDGSEFKDPRFEVETVEGKLEIVNRYIVPKINKTVEKTWELVEGEEKASKIGIVLKRYTADENNKETVKEIELNAKVNWSHTFEALEETDINGNVYTYVVEEEKHKAYTSTVEFDKQSVKFRVNNKSVVKDIPTNIVWENETGEPNPESVEVVLKRNGKPYKTITVTNNNRGTFVGVPTHDENGNPYNYEIEEVVPGYNTEIDQKTGEIKNIREKVSVEVIKTWIDEANDLDKPEEITINLYRNGEKTVYKTAKINEQVGWKHVFENLPKKDLEGKDYVYTVDEEAVAGYEKTIKDKSITNTRILHKITVTKIWNQVEEIYPESITFKLLRDGKEIAEHKVTESESKKAGNWNYTFEVDKEKNKLPKINPKTGKDYVYKVVENEVKGFTTTYSDDTFEITNKQKTKEITVEKEWKNGPQPTAKIHLLRKVVENGKEILDEKYNEVFEATVSKPSKKYIVPESDGKGREYIYYIEEEAMSNYSSTIEGFKAINSYNIPTKSITATKTWENAPANKPTIYFKLMRRVVGIGEFEKVPEAGIVAVSNSGEEGKVTWTSVEETDLLGNEYEFKVVEVDATGEEFVPENYKKTELGLTVVNTYNPPEDKKEDEVIEITEEKDGDNRDNSRYPRTGKRNNIPRTGISNGMIYEVISAISLILLFSIQRRKRRENR